MVKFMSDDPDIEIQKVYFDKICNDLSGIPFQIWFEGIMKHLDANFSPIGHEGRQGDHGCDGFSILTGRFYQVYAPESMKEDLEKVERDFKRALDKWGKRINEWIFVHGKIKKKPTIIKLVQDLANENNIIVTPWNNVDLWKILLDLPRDERIDLLGIPPHFKDEPMRRIFETHDMVKEIQEKTLRGSESHIIEFDEETVDLSRKIVGNISDIHNVPDIQKRKVFKFILSTSEDEGELSDSFNVLAKIFPDDYELISSVIDRIPHWTDQIVERVLHQYLVESNDNRIPNVIYEVAIDSKRDQVGTSKPYRKVFFDLLGKHGTRAHIQKLKKFLDQEQNDIIKIYIENAISCLQKLFPEPKSMETETLKIRFRAELENISEQLNSGNYPMVDTRVLEKLMDNPSYHTLPIKTLERSSKIEIALRNYNNLRAKASPWLRMRAPGESYPIPTKYVGYVVIGFTSDLENTGQQIIGYIDELLDKL